MKRTRALVAAAVAAAVVALAACSPADDSDGGEGGGGSKTTLTYWDFIDPTQDNARSAALKENVAAFEKANPTIDVKLQVVSFGDLLSRLPQAAAAGQTPDVIKMYSPMLPQLADAGVYQALPDDYKQITDWLRPISAFTDAKKVQVAVPYEYRTCSLVYSTKILSKIGAKVPATWDQVVDVAGKAAKAGYVGFGAGFSEEDNSSLISELFDCFMSELDVPVSTDGKASFAVPKAEEFSQFLIDLKQAGGLGKSVVSDQYTNVTDGLSNGTTAMAVIGTHRIQTVQSVNKDVDWAPLPASSDGSTKGTTFGWTLGIGSSSKHADAAWKFIEYMTGPEAQARMATGGEVPVRSSTYDQPYFKTDDAKLVLAIKDYVTKNSEPREYSANWLSIANGLANAAQQMYLKGGTAAQFLESAQSAANG